MGTLLHDLRYAVRTLAKSPGFTIVAVVSLAVGIGVTAPSVFSVVSTLFLRSYGLPEGPAAVRVLGGRLTSVEYRELRDGVRSQLDLAAVHGTHTVLMSESGPERVGVEVVGEGYFAALGLKPVVGRLVDPEDNATGNAARCAISHGLWQRLLASDPQVVGRRLSLDGQSIEIAGIAPPGFRGTTFNPADVWLAARPDTREASKVA